MASTAKDHARIIWRMRLCSAFRAALACAIVGAATFYRPKFLADQLKFPAFSYVTVVLIVSDATLGDTLRGCWHALYATVQVVPLAMLGRWLVAPTASGGFPLGMAAIVVAMAAFLVVLPESTHLTAKRIALGQIALVCTEAVIARDDNKYGFMHPLHIGASTALGALACVLALLLPFPGLAHYKVQKLCKVYAENASERMKIYLKAFNAQDHQTKTELVLQAKPIAEMGNKLLQIIRISQEGMPWERPWSRYAKHDSINVVVNRLQSIELAIRAMEYSLVSSPSSPVQTLDQQQLSDVLQGLASQVQKKIDEIKHFSPFDSEKASPQTRDEFIKNVSLPLESIVPVQKYESACFFFSCVDMLNDTLHNNGAILPTENQTQTEFSIIQKLRFWFFKLTASERLESAFKYSISLGLAVLLGMIIERENGCWASLTVAISYVTGRQAIITIANTRAQGTALGSVYGVICCFLFHHSELKLLAILPWIIFTSILRHSKMYGQTGGVTAAIGALLILGRNNYTNPNEFAIGRLTSVFIGLSCFVVVELLLQPIRAATLAKRHVFMTLLSFKDCLNETRFYYSGRKIQTISKFRELREKERQLESLVKDADSEPDFWYLPFNTSCYNKMVKSLSNVVNMLYFVVYNLEQLSETQESGTVGKEFQKQLSYELEELQGTVNTSLEKVSVMKSIADQSQDMLRELEEGKLQSREKLNDLIIEEAMRITEEGCEDEKHLRILRCLGAIGFCISSLRKEVDEVDICIKEIVRWENNSGK
ncbi:hypothetical protein DH2020_017844 [Rehmannia glutinosa]|uniref:Integral membrane bound transporter domain-containing protein n=1 Tax=Rehmannia glutinosa TaxID=99300 RepID=A0ABR0WHN7_REHGL